MKKLLCRLFGHKIKDVPYEKCVRCGYETPLGAFGREMSAVLERNKQAFIDQFLAKPKGDVK